MKKLIVAFRNFAKAPNREPCFCRFSCPKSLLVISTIVPYVLRNVQYFSLWFPLLYRTCYETCSISSCDLRYCIVRATKRAVFLLVISTIVPYMLRNVRYFSLWSPLLYRTCYETCSISPWYLHYCTVRATKRAVFLLVISTIVPYVLRNVQSPHTVFFNHQHYVLWRVLL
jgi:hypothetical protein